MKSARRSRTRAKRESLLTQGKNSLPLGGFFLKNGGEEMKKKSPLSVVALILSVAVFVAVAAFLVFLAANNGVLVYSDGEERDYEIITDYTRTDFESENAPAGIITEYTFVLPGELGTDVYLAFYTVHQYCETNIDGKLVYSVKAAEESGVKTVGGNWVVVALDDSDAGKTVRVSITPVYGGLAARRTEFLIGSDLAIYSSQLHKDLPQLLLSALAMFIGAFFAALGAWEYFKRRQGAELVMLGLFSFLTGIWRFTDTRFTPFIFGGNPALVYYFSVAAMMLGVFPLIGSIRGRYDRAGRIIMDCACIGAACVSLVQLVLQITGAAELRESLFVTHIEIVAAALVILGNSVVNIIKNVKNRKRGGASEGRIVGLLPFVCVAGVLADAAAYYIRGNSSVLVFTLAAILVYTLAAGVKTLIDYAKHGSRLAEQEKELLKSRISLMLTQIKPHFLYNSLTSISELCLIDPERARDALTDFSAYLRNNMEFIDTDECVHFTNELKHVETYLKLEKMRFGDRLNVVYDVRETNFFIPPLTVQPLVENAVKHGICAKKQGGTVTLSVYKENDSAVITVTDDGAGFDAAEVANAGSVSDNVEQSHVGLFNVKRRLQMVAGATIKVESEKGKGTKATVIIRTDLTEKGVEKK